MSVEEEMGADDLKTINLSAPTIDLIITNLLIEENKSFKTYG
ncbi:hypothetical protein V7056_13045 [Bacillus sp. JJ664]